ncbi:MAG TPA: histidine phosphatase family protein [Flexivirga sp.]|uniref:histidine phosphatase family protein n=1 Tax=Flexivirga sp. TaxID=1962927 RepID=UPI002C606559|nr:histidine phosphatase family protein [Flexivirga sp.]HWC21713.1 histidine phosphatase family protein [Flexivirga sp.]
MTHPVYLVRHGQSEWNVRRLTQGQTPHPPLTALGRAQAGRAAELIAAELAVEGYAVRRIVSSDLTRAVQTAEIVAARLGGVMSSDIRLREQALGSLEGRGYEETWAAAQEFDWSDPTQPIAGGESAMDVHRRMAAVLAELPDDEVTVLVSHGDAIRAAVAHLSGVEPHEAEWVEVANGAVARISGGITWLA